MKSNSVSCDLLLLPRLSAVLRGATLLSACSVPFVLIIIPPANKRFAATGPYLNSDAALSLPDWISCQSE